MGLQIAPMLANAFPDRPLAKVVREGPAPDGVWTVDLTDRERTDAMVEAVRPQIVVHLAAHSSVAKARLAPNNVWRDNRDGSHALGSAIARHAPHATVLLASTAEVYGRNLKHGPATERTRPAPNGPYANSKRASEFVLEQLLPSTAQLIIARPFNHTGPGQLETFVVASFAAQLARIEAGLVPPVISVGNLEAKRDFLDVRDVASAYVDILKVASDIPRRTVLNVARGEAVSIRAILDQLVALSDAKVEVRLDPARLRPNEIAEATATTDRLAELIAWPPQRPLAETLRAVLDDQRRRSATTVR